jgi:hypothetical protein
MSRKRLLLVTVGIVNLILGVLLLFFPAQLMLALDLPGVESFFNVNLMGGVLFGIGAASLVERYSHHFQMRGLGNGGAILVKICGAGVPVFWLFFGNMDLSVGGSLFLWSIAIIVLGEGNIEMISGSWREQ